jgi:hypothetical protein
MTADWSGTLTPFPVDLPISGLEVACLGRPNNGSQGHSGDPPQGLAPRPDSVVLAARRHVLTAHDV